MLFGTENAALRTWAVNPYRSSFGQVPVIRWTSNAKAWLAFHASNCSYGCIGTQCNFSAPSW